MKFERIADVPADFQFRLSELLRIAEADGREEAMAEVQRVLADRRESTPSGEAWSEIVKLQDLFRSTKFLQEIPRGRDR